MKEEEQRLVDDPPEPGPASALFTGYEVHKPDSNSDDSDHSDIELYPPHNTIYPGYEPPRGALGHAPPAHPHGTEIHWATLAEKRALWWSSALVTGMFILSWYIFATILSMYNKWMFSAEYYGFTYPLFVTACHMVVQWFCAAMIRWNVPRFRPAEQPTRRQYITRILPTAASTGGDIGLSNLSLKTITLSLYTMCKSSALIFVLMFAFLFKLEKYSFKLVSVIALISVGVFFMVFNVTAVSIPGLIMVFSASAMGGLRWALTELIMNKRAMGLSNPFATIFWLAPLMGLILFTVSAIIEDWIGMFTGPYFANPLVALKSTAIIAFPGAVAFAMVSSEYFVIHRTGVVPLSVAGIFKEVSTIAFSAWIFGDKLTALNLIGCAITIAGIALYSFHKYQKSMKTEVPLDEEGNVVPTENASDDERQPLNRGARGSHGSLASRPSIGSQYAPNTPSSRSRRTPDGGATPVDTVPMTELSNRSSEEDERTNRLRDNFEGWNTPGESDYESEVDEEEVLRYRGERVGLRSRWNEWWDRPM
ncbi:hypothetical protein CspeluHIS016_0704060 [Cutaneotrichosporon spelunceum]|uniref:Sugar phosphate transporter domain-containing protein n=1 Tax=Cutaneotrichosporon spelunceum TaxID=1672016 RepID=A0AAD3YDQ8_9TREE|nr:hypothetical protein CspeluHIS016_0704060 [Cutaneotrichosporon spelunceum]